LIGQNRHGLSKWRVAVRHSHGGGLAAADHPAGANLMRYLVLIYTDEKITPTQSETGKMSEGYRTFTQDIMARGIMDGGEALKPVSTATTVRVRNGERLVIDGPFAETKEQLGGYYVLNCKDLDEAIDCAANIPGAKIGSIEIRPIHEMRPQ
jgi:hypothetical protein